ncbi:hypothetical protein ACFC5Z_14050 [Streptomyces sp. NPDC056004]|uniref:hypothetical protein n=1 Tax=Streptomyces sp. NPDC056004 TaxID=3345677 RepID=UPI0035D636F5
MPGKSELAGNEAEKPPLCVYAIPALMLSAGLVGIWEFNTWWAKLFSGIIIFAGLNSSINLAHAEAKAHKAGTAQNTRRPAMLFAYAAIVVVVAVASFFT